MTVLVILLLMLLVAIILGGLLVGSQRETAQQRLDRETREASRRVADLGHQTRAAILDEALRRGRQSAHFNSDGRYGPWND